MTTFLMKNKELQRITLVLASAGFGGLEKHVMELAKGLASKGFLVTLISDISYQTQFKDTTFNFIGINFERSRHNPFLLWQLLQAILQSRPDIIHVHGNKAAQLLSNLKKFGLINNITVVGSLHSQKSNTRMFAHCDTVIAVSEVAKKALSHNHHQIEVVLNGIQPPKKLAKQLKNPPIVLAVGRLEKVKGYDILIRAWQDLPAELWIVGEGSLRQEYETLIHQQPYPENIKLLGFRQDINELMSQSNLFVMSSHYEGCPYVMIEALLTQTPMVSTNVGAMANILPKKYLTKIGNSQELYETIAWALNNPIQVKEDYTSVFTWAEQNLTFNVMLQRIINIYHETYQKFHLT